MSAYCISPLSPWLRAISRDIASMFHQKQGLTSPYCLYLPCASLTERRVRLHIFRADLKKRFTRRYSSTGLDGKLNNTVVSRTVMSLSYLYKSNFDFASFFSIRVWVWVSYVLQYVVIQVQYVQFYQQYCTLVRSPILCSGVQTHINYSITRAKSLALLYL